MSTTAAEVMTWVGVLATAFGTVVEIVCFLGCRRAPCDAPADD